MLEPPLMLTYMPFIDTVVSLLLSISASSTRRSQSTTFFSRSTTACFTWMYSSTCGFSSSLDSVCRILLDLAAPARSSLTRSMASSNVASMSRRSSVSLRSHSPRRVISPNVFFSRFSVATVLPVVSFSRSSSLFRSSMRSRCCWFSILSWSKSMTCSTSPISSFCCSCCSSLAICVFRLVFFSFSFSITLSLAPAHPSRYRSIFSAAVLPVRKFSAPTTMSRLNSYVSFLVSAMRRSVSSSSARSSLSLFSPSTLTPSIPPAMTSISDVTMSYFSSVVKSRSLMEVAATGFGLPFLLPVLRALGLLVSSRSSPPAVVGGLTRCRYASNTAFSVRSRSHSARSSSAKLCRSGPIVAS
mmetsp:Transcript_26077/g.64137  ORF Transcript_26077/g.64137 Transcript_26077/m.64137 type:complete len:357 (+) Transcript_26077:200-1270(+)